MKNIFFKFSFLILFQSSFLFTVYSQEAASISVKIASAIKTGNAKELATFFQSNIELTVLENEGTYSKSQAEIILKDFFTKYPPKDFSINHNGSSKDLSQFYIGSYKTNNQQNYRIYFLMKSMSEKMLIQQLQIQE